MKRALTTITLAVLTALTFSTTASADAPSFDSDCVSTQWVIRNRGLEPFLISTPAGDPIGMIEVGVVYEPGDNLDSVIISNTVIVRPRCEVLAPSSTPARTRLPATGASPLLLAVIALGLVTVGAAVRRAATIKS